MWLKLVLLLLYGILLFVLSRVLETVSWYENGYWSRQLLDPFSLSVRKLKLLLDQRGVSYAGVVEKSELTTLVEDSGEAIQDELDSSVDMQNSTTDQGTSFTCGAHFYERVEDNKDSVWIVQVIHPPGGGVMPDSKWKELTQRLIPFGIHVGVFDCSLDYRFCDRKNWHHSRLILALPKGYNQAKDQVNLITYSGFRRNQAILDWISRHLESRIHAIKDLQELEDDWMTFDKNNDNSALSWTVHVIMLSKMLIPPMFLSVLSVKFTGRVKFGRVDIRTSQGKKILKRLQKSVNKPSYIVVTPEKTTTFGKRRGEILNHFSFDLFLRTLVPDINDFFKFGLLLVNSTCLMSIVTLRGNVFKRFGGLIWNIFKYNCLFLLLWLPIIGLFHIPYTDTALFYAAKFIRIVNCTEIAGFIRHDLTFYKNNPQFVIITLIGYLILAGFVHHRFYLHDEDAETSTDWWSFTSDGYFASYLFNPMTSLTRPSHPQDMEEGMELLIERLAVPNLWLQPIISNDYVKDLPIWTYTRHIETSGEEDGLATETEIVDGANGMSDNAAKSPTVCQHCIAAAGLPRNPTETECAEFIMDSDYTCLCGLVDKSGTEHDHNMNENSKHAHSSSDTSDCEQNIPRWLSVRDETPKGMLPATECVICLDCYHHGNVLCGLPCGHNFHENCIMGWIMRDNHCCPVCRWPTYKSKCKVHLHSE